MGMALKNIFNFNHFYNKNINVFYFHSHASLCLPEVLIGQHILPFQFSRRKKIHIVKNKWNRKQFSSTPSSQFICRSSSHTMSQINYRLGYCAWFHTDRPDLQSLSYHFIPSMSILIGLHHRKPGTQRERERERALRVPISQERQIYQDMGSRSGMSQPSHQNPHTRVEVGMKSCKSIKMGPYKMFQAQVNHLCALCEFDWRFSKSCWKNLGVDKRNSTTISYDILLADQERRTCDMHVIQKYLSFFQRQFYQYNTHPFLFLLKTIRCHPPISVERVHVWQNNFFCFIMSE